MKNKKIRLLTAKDCVKRYGVSLWWLQKTIKLYPEYFPSARLIKGSRGGREIQADLQDIESYLAARGGHQKKHCLDTVLSLLRHVPVTSQPSCIPINASHFRRLVIRRYYDSHGKNYYEEIERNYMIVERKLVKTR